MQTAEIVLISAILDSCFEMAGIQVSVNKDGERESFEHPVGGLWPTAMAFLKEISPTSHFREPLSLPLGISILGKVSQLYYFYIWQRFQSLEKLSFQSTNFSQSWAEA